MRHDLICSCGRDLLSYALLLLLKFVAKSEVISTDIAIYYSVSFSLTKLSAMKAAFVLVGVLLAPDASRPVVPVPGWLCNDQNTHIQLCELAAWFKEYTYVVFSPVLATVLCSWRWELLQ